MPAEARAVQPRNSDLQQITPHAEEIIESARRFGRRRFIEEQPLSEQLKLELFEKADRRDRIIQERINRSCNLQESSNKRGSKTLRYDPVFDIKYYTEVIGISDNKEHAERLAILDGYVDGQLRTYIGELVNTRISTIDYFLKKNINRESKMYGEGCAKSLQEMVRTGQQKRLEPDYANPIDWQREAAEILEMDDILDLRHAPVGTMKLAFSIPGGRDENIADTFKEFFEAHPEKDPNKYKESEYGHKFFDLFIVKEKTVKGKREKYIELQRHTYGLSTREIIERVLKLSSEPFRKYLSLSKEEREKADIAAILLSDPILITDTTPEELLTFLHKDHEYTSEEDYQHILAATVPLRQKYIQLLHQAPTEAMKTDLFSTLNHLINTTVRLQRALTSLGGYANKAELVFNAFKRNAGMSAVDIRREGRRVTEKPIGSGGCPGEDGVEQGSSSGLSDGSPGLSVNNSLWSVSEFGDSDEMGSLAFECTKGHKNTRPRHKKIPACTTCGEKFTC